MSKKLFYEELPPEESGEQSPSRELSPQPDAPAVQAERDVYEEVRAAANGITHIRFRIKPDYKSRYGGVFLLLLITVLAGAILMNISKSETGQLIIGIIMGVVALSALVVIIVYKVKSRKPYYCYYSRDERGIFCMSVIDDYATVFAYGVAYRIEPGKFYTLDAAAYSLWLDGEGSGIYSILNAGREDVSLEADGSIFVADGLGGGHSVYLSEGKIQKIVSEQPYATDVVDAKTGEAQIKSRLFEKVNPTEIFAWEIPAFVKEAFDGAGAELPDMM